MPTAVDRTSFRRIWALAWPTIAYSLLELSLGLADLLMVRSLGHEATAAVGLNRQITFLLEATVLAVATGVITLVSQGVGAGNRRQVDETVHQSLRLVLWLGIPATLIGLGVSRPLLVAMQASADTLEHGVPYLHIYFLGTVFAWANVVAAAIYRGSGDAVTPLKLAGVVSGVNVALNYVFIFGAGPIPAYDVAGAALGTVAARVVGAIIYMALLIRGTDHTRLRLRPWPRDDWSLIRRILRIGTPPALAGVLRNGARLVFLGILGATALGAALHAAVGVGMQIRLVSVLPALAFQVATATLVGQAIGAGDPDGAATIANRSLVLLGALMAGVVGLTFVAARPLAALFVTDPSVVPLAATVLRWFAVGQGFSALSICTQGALTGAGDTKPITQYTIVTQWGILLSLTALFVVGLEWIPEGPLLAWVVAPVLQFLLMQRLFLSGRWRRLRV